jgi:ABC-type spermidine/putrescine transport system permease subunit I
MEMFDNHGRKLIFVLLIMVVYIIVANPTTYNIVGTIVGLDNYDNANMEDRNYLLYIHSFVMALLTFILLLIYNPMNAK